MISLLDKKIWLFGRGCSLTTGLLASYRAVLKTILGEMKMRAANIGLTHVALPEETPYPGAELYEVYS